MPDDYTPEAGHTQCVDTPRASPRARRRGRRLRAAAFGLSLTLLGPAVAAGHNAGFGFVVADSFSALSSADLAGIFNQQAMPGILVFFRDRGWGMSFDYSFNWYDDAAGSWFDFDFRTTYDLHLFDSHSIDPFLQFGGALQMHADTDEETAPASPELEDATELGFAAVIGAGVNVFVGGLSLRAALHYQGIRLEVVGPAGSPTSIGPARLMLAAGFAFG